MRVTSIAFAIVSAVASVSAATVSLPAQAYCRGCSISPEAAAAAAAGAIYGSAILGGNAANARAYEPPPAPNSSATFRGTSGDKEPGCKNVTRRTWIAGSDVPPDRIDKCE